MKKTGWLLLGAVFLASCAGDRPSPRSSAPPPVRRPAGAEAAATPSQKAEMRAAQGLIDQGVQNFNVSQWDRAQYYFEQAAKIAPSYGLSYFWLARVSHEEGRLDQAFALLDKAALLLKAFPDWMRAIQSLREQWR